jgi:hypothetical protein
MRILTAGTVLAAVELAACGGGSGQPSDFLMSNRPGFDSGLVFVGWSAPQNGQASGTITVVAAAPAAAWDDTSPDPQPETVQVATQPITVTITGSKVSVHARGSNVNFPATLSGGTLTIPKDGDPGQTVNWVLHSSDQAAYARALATLRRQVAAANVDSDVRKLSTDAGSLAGDADAIHSGVQQAGTDLGTEKSDVAAGSAGDCITGDSAASDALIVNSDSGTVATAAGSLTSSINSVRAEVSHVGDDVATLQRLGGKPAGNAHTAVSSAQSDIASAVSRANTDIGTVNGYLQQAYTLANSLIASSCPGPSLGSPSPVPTIPS